MSVLKSKLRIVKDLHDLETENLDGIYVYINKSNFYKNYAMIVGPENTPYFGGFSLKSIFLKIILNLHLL